MNVSSQKLSIALACLLSSVTVRSTLSAQPVIPGSGLKVQQVGDNFEDPEWGYVHKLPKSTQNLDKKTHKPTGKATNGRWYEGNKRGQPDLIRRVSTPAGGLPGSLGALSLRSLQTGIPGQPSYKLQQDDFIADVMYRFGKISSSRSPSAVTRVFLPPVDEWENRSGCHFAFRVALETSINKKVKTEQRKRIRGRQVSTKTVRATETYWPGIFIVFEDKDEHQRQFDTAFIRIRGNTQGADFKAKQITKTGWWTLGISVTPDGMVHYYARPGVDDLTAEDYLTSQHPYGYRAERLRSFFYNVCNGDDGRTWSTEWIVDDPAVYVSK